MAPQSVGGLSECWRILRAIEEVSARNQEVNDEGRALKFLEKKSTLFMEKLNQGLVDLETSTFQASIQLLESFLLDLLKATTTPVRQGVAGSQLIPDLLDLNRRLNSFNDTFLIQTSNNSEAEVNLEALSHPQSLQSPRRQLLSDDVQWAMMIVPSATTTAKIVSEQETKPPAYQTDPCVITETPMVANSSVHQAPASASDEKGHAKLNADITTEPGKTAAMSSTDSKVNKGEASNSARDFAAFVAATVFCFPICCPFFTYKFCEALCGANQSSSEETSNEQLNS